MVISTVINAVETLVQGVNVFPLKQTNKQTNKQTVGEFKWLKLFLSQRQFYNFADLVTFLGHKQIQDSLPLSVVHRPAWLGKFSLDKITD